MRCQSCKHFDQRETVEIGYQVDDQGRAKRNAVTGWGFCASPKILRYDGIDENTGEDLTTSNDQAFACCDEYRAFLYVGPDFGCIHWEKK